jgi:FkbM family methyltransferase
MAALLLAGIYLWTKRWEVRATRKVMIWVAGDARGCEFPRSPFGFDDKLAGRPEEIRRNSKLLGQRSDGLQQWSTPHGNFWSPPSNALFLDLAEQSVDVYGSEAGVRKGDTVLDCGANVGTFTRSALARGAAKVVAFDIDPRNIECLRLTFASEIAEGKVVVIAKGVWDKEDTLEAKFYSNTNLNTVAMKERPETKEAPLTVLVPLTRIDSVVKELGLQRVDFIKMDVEGAETAALRGAREVIQRFHPRMSIAAENDPEDIETVPAQVRSFGIGYTMTPGDCRQIRRGVYRPESLDFAPPPGGMAGSGAR